MPIRKRPEETQRSEHWIRLAVNKFTGALNSRICATFGWPGGESIGWRSPLRVDGYSEYFDQEFLDRLGVSDLPVPLSEFCPRGGPRWDGLARTESGKLILVEAKAYIEEGVDYRSKTGSKSMEMIRRSLRETKQAFEASKDAPWESPFYQYANRLAHLYLLRKRNDLDAYLLFHCFADAPRVPRPCTTQQWEGAIRLLEKCLGFFAAHPFRQHIGAIIWSVPELSYYS